MLARLKVNNFKCLKSLDINLSERNVFIGSNKSGKSSILQALQSLTASVVSGNIVGTFGGEVGFQEFLWKGDSRGGIRIEIVGDDRPVAPNGIRPLHFRYVLEVGLDARQNLAILEEYLGVKRGKKEIPLIRAKGGRGSAHRISGKVVFENPQSSVKPFLAYEVPGWEADRIRRFILAWHFFAFLPDLPKFQATPSVAQMFLDQRGGQISSWLQTFQSNYPESFKQVVSVAKEAFPEIEALTLPVTQVGTTYLATKERGLKRAIPIFHFSDGEVKFLQLLGIIFSPLRVALVAVEHPEDGLHPRLLQLLVETANRVRIEAGQNAAQVFATTHSPYLVDLLSPEDVVVVEKHQGATKCTRVQEKRHLRQLLEESELSFGRLWYSGALGGV